MCMWGSLLQRQSFAIPASLSSYQMLFAGKKEKKTLTIKFCNIFDEIDELILLDTSMSPKKSSQ